MMTRLQEMISFYFLLLGFPGQFPVRLSQEMTLGTNTNCVYQTLPTWQMHKQYAYINDHCAFGHKVLGWFAVNNLSRL